MRISVVEGDITTARAEAICTSTNARLTLMMGTGAAVREAGGFEVLRACENVLRDSGQAQFAPGTAIATTAGRLPYKAAIHCVASDPRTHLTSDAIIRACVKNALARADELHVRTLTMPLNSRS